MVVIELGRRGGLTKFPVISLEDLEALFKASSVELGRRFGGARRVGDQYLLPIQAVPWFTLIDLGREYPINGLVIKGVVIDGPLNKPWFSVVLGLLAGDYVLGGVSVVGRRAMGCRSFPLNPPLDLWDLPRGGLAFPRLTAVVNEVNGGSIDVSAPMNCLGGALGLNPNQSTASSSSTRGGL